MLQYRFGVYASPPRNIPTTEPPFGSARPQRGWWGAARTVSGVSRGRKGGLRDIATAFRLGRYRAMGTQGRTRPRLFVDTRPGGRG
jgi:hypothetical protein